MYMYVYVYVYVYVHVYVCIYIYVYDNWHNSMTHKMRHDSFRPPSKSEQDRWEDRQKMAVCCSTHVRIFCCAGWYRPVVYSQYKKMLQSERAKDLRLPQSDGAQFACTDWYRPDVYSQNRKNVIQSESQKNCHKAREPFFCNKVREHLFACADWCRPVVCSQHETIFTDKEKCRNKVMSQSDRKWEREGAKIDIAMASIHNQKKNFTDEKNCHGCVMSQSVWVRGGVCRNWYRPDVYAQFK